MKHPMYRWPFVLLFSGALALVATQSALAGGKSIGAPSGVVPAQVEKIPGSDLHKVTLTARAIERIDLQTDSVREAYTNGSRVKVVPYSSLIYDPHGGTWVYTSPAPRTFVRHAVEVDRIEGDRVFLRDGPAVGTAVASVGVAELYGTEFEVGH